MLETSAVGRAQLPRPDVSAADAAELCRVHFGLEGGIVELGSQQDRNFRIDTASGRFVLKICHADYATVELEAQNATLKHLAAIGGAVRVPSLQAGMAPKSCPSSSTVNPARCGCSIISTASR